MGWRSEVEDAYERGGIEAVAQLFGEDDMRPTMITNEELGERIAAAARDKNNWTLVHAIQTSAGGGGHVPHGYVMIYREHFPFPDKGYATAGWNEQKSTGIGFESGNYDLTQIEAWTDLLERSNYKRL